MRAAMDSGTENALAPTLGINPTALEVTHVPTLAPLPPRGFCPHAANVPHIRRKRRTRTLSVSPRA